MFDLGRLAAMTGGELKQVREWSNLMAFWQKGHQPSGTFLWPAACLSSLFAANGPAQRISLLR